MKKIVIISCVFPPEPVVSAQISFDIADELSKDNNVIVISPSPTRPENFKFENIIPKYTFNHIKTDSFTSPKSRIYSRMKESYSFGKFCSNYIKKHYNNIDVIYANSWPLLSQYFIVKTAKKYNIPCVVHIQDIYPESLVNRLPVAKSIFFKILLPLDKFILKNSKKVICISENMMNTLSKVRKIPKEKFSIVVNWQNEGNFINYKKEIKISQRTDKPFTFMYLGNNGPVAGVEFLIESFVKASVPDTRLIIAGSGSKTEDCKDLVKKLGATNIEFIPVPDGKVPEVQDMADAMLLPVKKNGAYSSIPSKLPAYMFSAKPVLGSLDVDSDTACAISDADAGMVVESENEEKLMDAMKLMASWSKEKLQEKGENAFNYAMKHFSRSSNLKKIKNIILNI